MLGYFKCMMEHHEDKQIQGMCQNKFCNQRFRRICFECIKAHQMNDQFFDISDIKNENEIEQIIDQYKESHIDSINNIILQCMIQQYLLNIEMIEKVKLWNYKYNKLNEVLFKVDEFTPKKWNQININNYIGHQQQKISIYEYLQQNQQSLKEIDELKDDYIKNIISKQNYEETKVNTKEGMFTQEIVQTINKYKNKLLSNIRENDLFQKKNYQNEESIITICELMLKQGYDLKVDSVYNQFKIFQDKIIDESIEQYKQLYIQGFALSYKYKVNQDERGIGLSLINQSLKLNKNYAKSYWLQGDLYYLDSRYDEAVQMYDEAVKIDPEYVQAQINKDLSQFQLNQHDQAILIYKETLKKHSKLADAYHNKGTSLASLNQHLQAIKMYDWAIKIEPNLAYAYNNKGLSLAYLNQHDEAILMFQKTINLDPKFTQAYNNKAISHIILKQYDQAKMMYDKSINIKLNLSPTFNNIIINVNLFRQQVQIAILLQNLKQSDQAMQMQNEAINIDPNFAQAYNNKGILLQNIQCNEESRKMINMVDQIFTQAYVNIGVSQANLKKYEIAILMYNEAIRIDSKYANAYFHKADALFLLAQYQESKNTFVFYLTFVPNDTNAIEKIKQCEKHLIIQQ